MRKLNNIGILPGVPLKITLEDKSLPTCCVYVDKNEDRENAHGNDRETLHKGIYARAYRGEA